MACYCSHIRCFDCNKYGHVAADCPDKIPLSGTQHEGGITPPVGMIDPHLGTIATTGIPTVIIEIGTGSVIPDLTHTILDIGVTAILTSAGVIPDHFIDLHIIAPHTTEAQVHTGTTVTHHIADPHPVEIFPEMTANLDHTNPTNNSTNQHKDLLQAQKQHLGKIKTEDTNRLQLMIHPQNTTAQMIKIVTLRTV